MRSGCPCACCRATCRREHVYRWFAKFRDEDRFAKINHALVMLDRERTGRQCVLRVQSSTPRAEDRRSWRATRLRCRQEDQRTQAPCTRRYGWPLLERTRQASKIAMAADAPTHLASHFSIHPTRLRRRRVWGEKVANATLIAVEIVRKNPDQIGFAVQPRRWVVERFFAWIGRNRRLAKDLRWLQSIPHARSLRRLPSCSSYGALLGFMTSNRLSVEPAILVQRDIRRITTT